MRHITLLGEAKTQWAKFLAQNIPKTSKKRTTILLGSSNQILLSLLLKITGKKIIWLAQKHTPGLFLKFFSTFADAIIAPNQFIETGWLSDGVSSQKIHLIYPVCEFNEEERASRAPNMSMCYDGSENTNEKISSVIKGVKLANEIIGPIKITINCQRKNKNNLEWLVEKLNMKKNTIIMSSKTNEWIKSSDIYIYSSAQKNEPPMSIIQAMTFAKPIIAENNQASREFLKQKENAVLIDNPNAEMISQAIINLYRNEKWMKSMSKKNFLFAKEKFSQKIFNNKINELFS